MYCGASGSSFLAAQQDLSPSPTWYVRIHVDDHVPGYEEKAVNCESENTGRELTGSGLARTVATRSLGVLRSAGREAVVLGSVVVVPGSVVVVPGSVVVVPGSVVVVPGSVVVVPGV